MIFCPKVSANPDWLRRGERGPFGYLPKDQCFTGWVKCDTAIIRSPGTWSSGIPCCTHENMSPSLIANAREGWFFWDEMNHAQTSRMEFLHHQAIHCAKTGIPAANTGKAGNQGVYSFRQALLNDPDDTSTMIFPLALCVFSFSKALGPSAEGELGINSRP